jgi:single-stranded-DNA-specific exonuclease
MSNQIEGGWTLRPCPEEKVVDLVRALAISPWLARILVGRGVETPEEAKSFLQPESQPYHDPFPLPGLDPFLQRVEKAIRSKERVVVHGDYDADGVTSSAILVHALRRVGLDPVVFLPSRFEGGYGIQPEWVEAQKEEGHDLIVTTDCGSSAVEAARKAVEVGIDLIVTDHHTPDPDLEGPVAHVNPHLPDSEYPFRDLCGAGVALKLAQALVAFVPPSFQAQCRRDLPVDLAAIGTLADVMPLVDENRRIVVDGLDRVRTHPSPGVMALLESAGCDPAGVNCETVAYQIGPRLNAAGRLGSPRLAFDLLTEEDPVRARELALELDGLNNQRKKLGAQGTLDALDRIKSEPQEAAVVLADERWHRGVLGILAARIAEETGLPTFVASDDGETAHGSARVPDGFNAVEILGKASDFTERGGGHAGAAGFTVSMSHWEDFASAIRDAVRESAAEAVPPELSVDAFLAETGDTGVLFREISRLEPYGQGFPPPVLSICRFESGNRHSVFGKSHLKIQLGSSGNPLEAIGFGLGEWATDLERKPVDLALEYGENHWNGRTSLRPRIVAIRPSLKEDTERGANEEVVLLDREGGGPSIVVWDARGNRSLSRKGCLRVGYGPEWREWWKDSVPGAIAAWKDRVWEGYGALPAGGWPGGCSVGYGGEVPEEWNREVIEILWPPLRKADRQWLADLVKSSEVETLVRFNYSPNEIEEWLSLSEAEPTRENVATVYRALTDRKEIKDLFSLALPPATVAVCLEVLLDLSLVEWIEGTVAKVQNPPKQKLEESLVAKNWAKFQESLKKWGTQAISSSVEELARRWVLG